MIVISRPLHPKVNWVCVQFICSLRKFWFLGSSQCCWPLHWPAGASLQECICSLLSSRSHSIYSHAQLLMSFATGVQFRWQGGLGLSLSVQLISVVSPLLSVSLCALLSSSQLFLSVPYLWYGGLCIAQCLWSLCWCVYVRAFNFVWCTWACVISQLP